jgi:hypothetical protein
MFYNNPLMNNDLSLTQPLNSIPAVEALSPPVLPVAAGLSIVPSDQSALAVICKRCHSARVTKSGFLHGLQRYFCKDCGTVFQTGLAPFHSRLPAAAVVVALERFFSGQPLDFIRFALEESLGLQITVTGLEKMIYRYSRKAIQLAGEITPLVGPRWFLDVVSHEEGRPVVFLDVVDLQTGFLIASDILPDFTEKDRESLTQRALRITGATPELLIISTELCNPDDLAGQGQDLSVTRLKKAHRLNLLKFRSLSVTRAQLFTRRLNFDSLANCRLICAAWRIHYNFMSGRQPVSQFPYRSWADIVNAPAAPRDN